MERRYTVWVGGGEMNDRYLTKKEAESLADNCRATGYDDVVIEEMKGSITASDFIEWYFSDEDDVLNIGREVISALRTTGYSTITVKSLFDSCGYIRSDKCTIFNADFENISDDYELQPSDLIFIDDLTEVKTCYDCRHQYTGDLDFCPKCLTCVS
jgi:hypothetical protein